METKYIFYIICALICLIMLILYCSRQRKITSFLFGSLSGILALVLVCRYGTQVGIEIPMNIFNLCGSGILGIPFVVILAIICH